MSDTAWDAISHKDKDIGAGTETRILAAQTHLAIPSALWTACRAAAVLGQSDFDTWVSTSSLPSATRTWYAGLTAPVKAAIREGALGLAA